MENRNSFISISLIISLYLGALFFSATASAISPTSTENYNCAANPTWFSAPSMPLEVKKSARDGTSNFCDFYQFSWQAFAYLMAPSSSDKRLRNFEDRNQYPELRVDSSGAPANSCDSSSKGTTLFVRNVKSGLAGDPFLIPERIGQAGGGATIYDQQGNVVYYDIKFDRGTCDVEKVKDQANFPSGTTELKTAWKVIKDGDTPSNYITMEARIGSDKKTTLLGMIGFHIAIATKDHPEFVWATFEHNTNIPNCVAPKTGVNWSFISAACESALANQDNSAIIQCNFNHPTKQSSITGTPTEICRYYANGSAPGDPHYDENVGDITSLNTNVQPYLKGEAFSVLSNYFNLGALWLSDPSKDSDISNQRGSLRLANAVAETDYMDVNLDAPFISNCFGCHNYKGTAKPSEGKNTTSGALSHIFDDIAVGLGQCLDVQTKEVINNQDQANQLCPKTCAGSSSRLNWNGQWTNQSAQTAKQLPMTVCGCCGS